MAETEASAPAPAGRPEVIEKYRQSIPLAVKGMAQVMVDNPGQFALLAAGTIVATRAAANLVRPRTAVQALALGIVLQMGLPVLAMEAVKRGWVRIRVRDADGCLVPLAFPGAD
ncbi:MAG TPA: hypothetical protein VMV92_00640 [Streptosporangiaceae bacterium]|nr:hypothetical protein [Streptosporangiaceae bacterium]